MTDTVFRPRRQEWPADYASGFESLGSYLNSLRVDTGDPGGLSTSGCVRATTIDTMHTASSRSSSKTRWGDRDRAIRHANLFDMQLKMAEVWPLARAQEYLGQLAAAAR